MPYRNILVGIDGSEQADNALEQAILLTHNDYHTQLHIIHVFQFPIIYVGETLFSPSPISPKYQTEKMIISRAQERISSIPQARVIHQYGSPGKTILEYAVTEKCDLIIIGDRGLGGFRGNTLGSVSHYVVQNAKVPVLVVKQRILNFKNIEGKE